MQDIDKLKQIIEDGLVVYQDVSEALKSDDKITLMEGGILVVKHGGKAVRLIGSIKELAEEIRDLDGEEMSELTAGLVDQFGGSAEAKEAILDIAEGAGKLNQGIQKLISLS